MYEATHFIRMYSLICMRIFSDQYLNRMEYYVIYIVEGKRDKHKRGVLFCSGVHTLNSSRPIDNLIPSIIVTNSNKTGNVGAS